MPEEPAAPTHPPLRFGRYEVPRDPDGRPQMLGRGGMGVTYRAWDAELHRDVVLKVIASDITHNPVARKRFLREAKAAARCGGHPHIVSVFDIGVQDGEDYYVMEFLAGENLSDQVRARGPLSAAEALVVAEQVAEAFEEMERHELVHRDIKPMNLMAVRRETPTRGGAGATPVPVTPARRRPPKVVLIDFGLAKAADAQTTEVTSTGHAAPYTALYASPEQVDPDHAGRELDIRSDIYSLGATICFLLAGRAPFEGTRKQVEWGHMTKPPPVDALRALGVPEPFVALLARMLAKRPEDRPQSAHELIEELGAVRAALPTEQRLGVGASDSSVALEATTDIRAAAPPPIPGAATFAPPVAGARAITDLPLGSVRLSLAEWRRTRPGPLPWREAFPILERVAFRVDVMEAAGHAVRALSVGNATVCFDPEEAAPRGGAAALAKEPPDLWPPFECEVRDDSSPPAAPGASVVRPFALFAWELLAGRPWTGPQDNAASLPGAADAVLRQTLDPASPASPARNARAWLHSLRTAERTGSGSDSPAAAAASSVGKKAEDLLGEIRDRVQKHPWLQGKEGDKEDAPKDVRGWFKRYPWLRFAALVLGLALLIRVVDGGRSSSDTSRRNGRSVTVKIEGDSSSPAPPSLPALPRGPFTRPSTEPPAPPRAPEASEAPPAAPTADFTNTLGMPFRRVPGTEVAFCMWETRVRDFRRFLESSDYSMRRGETMISLDRDGWKAREDFSWKKPGFAQSDQHPVVGVSWEDAQAFCDWLTKRERSAKKIAPDERYRLPRDWEWSVAVGLDEPRDADPQAKDGLAPDRWPWGAWPEGEPPPRGAGNYAGTEARVNREPADLPIIEGWSDDFARTAPAGKFPPGASGLHDLGGNVWEWCEDALGAGSNARVLRGGSWADAARGRLLSSRRDAERSTFRSTAVGFRVVLGK